MGEVVHARLPRVRGADRRRGGTSLDRDRARPARGCRIVVGPRARARASRRPARLRGGGDDERGPRGRPQAPLTLGRGRDEVEALRAWGGTCAPGAAGRRPGARRDPDRADPAGRPCRRPRGRRRSRGCFARSTWPRPRARRLSDRWSAAGSRMPRRTAARHRSGSPGRARRCGGSRRNAPPAVLVHGDFDERNILRCARRKVCAIDPLVCRRRPALRRRLLDSRHGQAGTPRPLQRPGRRARPRS